MFGILKSIFGSGGEDSPQEKPIGESVSYEGCTITAIDMRHQGQYQTCALIEADVDGKPHRHKLIRADLHASAEGAADFAIMKAKRMIDEQGTRFLEAVVEDAQPEA